MCRKKVMKLLAVMMALEMVTASVTGCGMTAKKESTEASDTAGSAEKTDEDRLLDAMSAVSTVGAKMAKKQETVYVKTNANGAVDSVVVSDWLKNDNKSGVLKDASDLKDIKNIKGNGQFEKDGEDLVWDASGEDIYYQGTTDKKLPVDVVISYTLDGKDITPEEIAGKSGHVSIKMAYENHDAQTVDINGEKETIYTPFAVMSGMMLDNEKFTGVSVTNGTVISDGNKDIVVGMAFPGLVDSLNGKKVSDDTLLTKIEDEIKIPSEITVEADAKDFELGMTLTMVSSDVMGALGLENVDTKSMELPNLRESMNDFEDAGEKLVEGTGELRDGAGKLYDGTMKLADGTGELYDGVKKYTDGVGQVNDGAGKLYDGAGKLDSGVSTLKDGIDRVDDGAGALSDGISKVDSGAGSLKDGIDQVNKGAGTLKDGIGSAAEGADKVSAGAKQVNDGAAALKSGADQVSAGLQGLQSGMGKLDDLKAGLGQAAAGASDIGGKLEELAAFADSMAASSSSPAGASQETVDQVGHIDVSTEGMDEETAALVMEAVGAANEQIDAANGQIDDANSRITALGEELEGTNEELASANAYWAGMAAKLRALKSEGADKLAGSLSYMDSQFKVDELKQGVGALSDGAQKVADGAANLSAGTEQLSTGANDLSTGMHKLSSGAADLQNGTEKLSGGASELKDGTSKLSSGASELKDGTSKLSSGASELKSGSSSLLSGTGELLNGTLELNSNSASLLDGTWSVLDGAAQLNDGAGDLFEGTKKLDDGMVKFDEEGISKLTELFDTDLDSMEKRVKAISDAGKAYRSFGGSAASEDGSVRFVIESAAVKQ